MGHVGACRVARRSGIATAVRAVHGGMVDLAAGGVALEDGPFAVAAFEGIGHLHGGAFLLGAEENLGLSVIAIDGDLLKLGFHGGEVQPAIFLQMLEDAGADGLVIRARLVASGGEHEQCGGGESYSQTLDVHDFFGITDKDFIALSTPGLSRNSPSALPPARMNTQSF